MSIDSQPGRRTFAPPPAPTWGELTPEGRNTQIIRFALTDRVVTIPIAEIRRWEHQSGEPEVLTISTSREQIVVEGQALGEVRAALDVARLCEIRTTFARAIPCRPGPRIMRITIEAA